MTPATDIPRAPGDVVRVRSRRYLVEAVTPPPNPGDQTLARLSCLEDDAEGEELEVLWEKELDARRVTGADWSRLAQGKFDLPRHFAAYYHTLRWNTVTSTDPTLFQAPYRAGIRIDAYQLEPLRKGPAAAAREPVHRRRRGARQDDRGRPRDPGAAAAQPDPPRDGDLPGAPDGQVA